MARKQNSIPFRKKSLLQFYIQSIILISVSNWAPKLSNGSNIQAGIDSQSTALLTFKRRAVWKAQGWSKVTTARLWSISITVNVNKRLQTMALANITDRTHKAKKWQWNLLRLPLKLDWVGAENLAKKRWDKNWATRQK